MMYEMKDRFSCSKPIVCTEACSACASNGACTFCASYGEPDVCVLCDRHYSAELLPLMRTMCDAHNRVIELLGSYEFMDYNNIPADVQAQADAASAEFSEALAAYGKLRGVEIE